MLDLLAVIAADPLSASAWAILLLAGGMYPVGFMLGASCSACCNPSVPCTCTHFANGEINDTYRCPYTGWTIQFSSGGSTGTGHLPADGNPHSLDSDLSLSFSAIAEIDEEFSAVTSGAGCSGALIETVGAGCEGCSYQVWLRCAGLWTWDGGDQGFDFYLKYQPYNFVAEANDLTFVSCQDTSKTAAFTSDKTVLEMLGGDAGNLFDVVTALEISITLSREACECFTCCRNSEIDSMQCEELVAANLCSERFRSDGACGVDACQGGACCAGDGCHIAYDEQQCLEATSNTGVWQGAGTTCDPDPCS
jgi:hypothetical protein